MNSVARQKLLAALEDAWKWFVKEADNIPPDQVQKYVKPIKPALSGLAEIISDLDSSEKDALNSIIDKYRLNASISSCRTEGEALANITIALAKAECTLEERKRAFIEMFKILGRD